MAYTKDRTTKEDYTYHSSDRFGGPPRDWVKTSNVVTLQKTKTGEYLPNWKNLVKSGSSATTPFTGNIQSVHAEPGHMKVNFWYPLGQPRSAQRPEWVAVRGYYLSGSAYSTSTGANVTSANSAALVQLAKKIEQGNSHFMGGVLIGEVREVVRMITRPAKSLREGIQGYISALSKRKGRAPKHRLNRILADTWLEYSFGWQPLISDIKAAAETLARWNSEVEADGYVHNRTALRAFSTTQAVMSNASVSQQSVNNYCYHFLNSIEMADAKVIYRVGMDYKTLAPVGSAARLAQLSGLNNGLVGWIPTVWELIPWSFVVDYFSNVGDVINFHCVDKSNMTWINKSVVQSGWREQTARVDSKRILDAITAKDLISIEGDSLGSVVSKRTSVSRTAPSTLDYPKLEFQYPAFGSTKWINLAALWQGVRNITPYR